MMILQVLMVKNMDNNFCIFILSHGRPNSIHTLKSLKKHGYTGKWFIIIDNEDKTSQKYIDNFGDKVIMFDKLLISKGIDEADNFNDRRAIVYARNVCFKIAEERKIEYFMQLDDDYTEFSFSFDNKNNYVAHHKIKNLDKILKIMLEFFENTNNIKSIAMAQGGDFIGGVNSKVSKNFINNKFVRKAMNSFLCSTKRPFKFLGRINEDVNTYTYYASLGNIFLTIPSIRLEQKQTQKNDGGMTDIYLDSGTYVKSFYSIIFAPSSVDIRLMGAKNKRLHHHVNWNYAIPMIVSEEYKKE